MPLLSRHGTRSLLRTVNGKTHATDQDHEEARPTTTTSKREKTKEEIEEEINRSPRSSDSESSPLRNDATLEGKSSSNTTKRPSTPNLFAAKPTKRTNKPRVRAPTRAACNNLNEARKRRAENEHDDVSPKKRPLSPTQSADSWNEAAFIKAPMRKMKTATYGRANIRKTTFGPSKSSSSSAGTNTEERLHGSVAKSSVKPENGMAARFAGLSKRASPVQEEPVKPKDDLGARFALLSAPKQMEDEHPPSSAESLKERFTGLGTTGSSVSVTTATTSAPRNDTLRYSSPLSSPPDSEASDVEGLEYTGAICPFCREPVDPTILQAFLGTRRALKVRQQNEFHVVHKKHSALQEYRKQGYPEVDWGSLENRLASHHTYLESILEDSVPSHFRNVLADKVDRGKERTLIQTENTGALSGIMPGYYGTHGARLMADYIIRKYGTTLRHLAVKDKTIASRDTTGFVQAVLVPELAMKLIMEDMDVDEGRAREIMQESALLGDLVNEEVDDILRMTQAASQNLSYGHSESGSDSDLK